MPVSPTHPGEVIDVRPFGSKFADASTNNLIQTEHLKVVRMVMPAGKVLPEHTAPGDISVHCLEGQIAFTTMGKTEVLGPGQLLCLTKGERHSVEAIENSSFLLTIALTG